MRSTKRLRSGLSLLEVILALAILAGAVAVLGEVSGMGMRNARLARDLTCAQLLCESKMAEIVAGVETASAKTGESLDTTGSSTDAAWLYSVELEDTSQDGLVEIRVTVYQDLPAEQAPPRFTLTRWIVDPSSSDDDDEETETESTSETGTKSSTTSSGSSS